MQTRAQTSLSSRAVESSFGLTGLDRTRRSPKPGTAESFGGGGGGGRSIREGASTPLAPIVRTEEFFSYDERPRFAIGIRRKSFTHTHTHTRIYVRTPRYKYGPYPPSPLVSPSPPLFHATSRNITFLLFTEDVNSCASSRLYDRKQRIKMSLF